MRIRIVTAGSRGDIEPLAILACGLRAVGHDVGLAANDEGAGLCESHGVPFLSLGFGVEDLLASPTAQAMLASGSASLSHALLIELCAMALPQAGPRIFDACRDAELVLCQDNVFPECLAAAQAFGHPLVSLNLMPYGATASYPHPYASDDERRGLPAVETHRRALARAMQGTLAIDNQLRREHLGLPPLTVDELVAARESMPALLGYSPTLCPPPADWPATRIVTGAWHASQIASPEPRLADFVAGGPAPIYVGFGSMAYDARELIAAMAALSTRHKWRFVYANPRLDEATPGLAAPEIFVARSVPHDWLLPRCTLALHHGGAGTTAASTRAGVPTLIAWFIVDQRLWAERVAILNVGRNLGAFVALSLSSLGDMLEEALSDADLRQRCASLGARIAAERGVEQAVATLPRLAASYAAARTTIPGGRR